MKPLRIFFVLQQNNLHVVVKGGVESYDLRAHDFDATQEIVPGKNANHLMKAALLVKSICAFIRSSLTSRERLMYSWAFAGKDAVFISDIQLNNLGIKHFIDFTEQCGAHSCSVYTEVIKDAKRILNFVDLFMDMINTKEPIGGTGKNGSGNFYRSKDDSIEMSEERRVT